MAINILFEANMIQFSLMGKYKRGVLGGTFDHFHAGHASFLKAAIKNCESLLIGLTENDFSKDKPFSELIEDYSIRRQNLLDFLAAENYSTAEIMPINDPFSTSVTDESLDAIFVTDHGKQNAEDINDKRAAANLNKLTIEHVDYLLAFDGQPISSTRIRSGEIDKAGNRI